MPASSPLRFPVIVTALGFIAASVAGVLWLSTLFDEDLGSTARYAIAFALIESGIVALLIVGLVGFKTIRRYRTVTLNRRRQIILELIATSAPDPKIAAEVDAQFAEVAARWPRQMIEVLDEALGFLQGSAQLPISQATRSLSFRRLLTGALKSGSPKEAARALRVLGELGTGEAWALIVNALNHKSETIRIAAKRAILARGDSAKKLEILKTLPGTVLWERVVVFHSLEVDVAVIERYLQEALASSDIGQHVAALELIHSRRLIFPHVVSPAFAESPEPEVRIKFFKALPFLAVQCPIQPVLKLGLADADWRVRAMAAQASVQFRPASLVKDLLALCGPTSRPAEVRHAARALAALGGEALFHLERMAASDLGVPSRIAADVIEQRILERAGSRQ